MNISAQALLQQISEIMALISDARMALKDGRVVDLVEVQGQVTDLCSTIHNSPEVENTELASSISTLVEHFDALGQELTDHHKNLSEEIIRKAAFDTDSGHGNN